MPNNALELQETTRLTGFVERIIFHSTESGYCVLSVRLEEESNNICVVGTTLHVQEGFQIECKGEWIQHAVHGKQFKAFYLAFSEPNHLKDIEKYLSSGVIKGVGPHVAKIMTNAFGRDIFDVMTHEPKRLLEVEGIGGKRLQAILSSWSNHGHHRHIMIALQSYGIQGSRAAQVYKCYGDDVLQYIQENPYRLIADIDSIGFKTADDIAKKTNISHDAAFRVQAGIHYVLTTCSNQGHCAVKIEQLIEKSAELLKVPVDLVQSAITHEINASHLISNQIDGETVVFLKHLFYSEACLAQNLFDLMQGRPPWDAFDIPASFAWLEKQAHLIPSASQKEALMTLLSEKVCIVTGGPGVGKTTIINSLLKLLSQKSITPMLCAPTGRAAKRLSEATGYTAKTIHRLLEFSPITLQFKHDESNVLTLDILIVDEASMLDMLLMHHLLKAIPKHAALILVGDVDQLPSVGAGQILRDCIESNVIKTVRLTETFRQGKDSQIILNANRINQGYMPLKHNKTSDFYTLYLDDPDEIKEKICDLVARRLPNYLQLDPIQHIQVLTPVRRGSLGSLALNLALKNRLNSQSFPQITKSGMTFSPGDKVIQTVNNYDKEVFNGDIGFIDQIDTEVRKLLILFDDRLVSYEFNELNELSLAYAISIHKSQGSEYPVVVIPFCMQHYSLLKKNLVYTGVTRGKRLVVVLAQKKALAMAVYQESDRRLTKLKQHLYQLTADETVVGDV
ncbi:MAG: ATP-dependent RecD-like DNA helicase [Endozoicomonadaceae bacterium]|nr:ATP-dependent RecD-like DNA helicase [Endozoicomonadaceae bacterium]